MTLFPLVAQVCGQRQLYHIAIENMGSAAPLSFLYNLRSQNLSRKRQVFFYKKTFNLTHTMKKNSEKQCLQHQATWNAGFLVSCWRKSEKNVWCFRRKLFFFSLSLTLSGFFSIASFQRIFFSILIYSPPNQVHKCWEENHRNLGRFRNDCLYINVCRKCALFLCRFFILSSREYVSLHTFQFL